MTLQRHYAKRTIIAVAHFASSLVHKDNSDAYAVANAMIKIAYEIILNDAEKHSSADILLLSANILADELYQHENYATDEEAEAANAEREKQIEALDTFLHSF